MTTPLTVVVLDYKNDAVLLYGINAPGDLQTLKSHETTILGETVYDVIKPLVLAEITSEREEYVDPDWIELLFAFDGNHRAKFDWRS